MTIIDKIRMSLLAAWLGVAIFFSATVAPNVFRVLAAYRDAFGQPKALEMAGVIVSQTLSVVNTSGFVISVLSLLVTFALRKIYRRGSFIIQSFLIGVVVIATGVGEWYIAPRMRNLRYAMRLPLDQMALNDPDRVLFQTLHSYSVAALSVAMIAAVLVILLMVLSQGRTTSISTK